MSAAASPALAPSPVPVEPEREWDIPIPDISNLIIQDDTPLDNLLHEKQMRLLTEPLYSSWFPEQPFLALANVGLFHEPKQTPVVPDAMLSVNVTLPKDWRAHKEHLSYFVWERGKAPDVVIEIVSDKRGGERTHKMQRYAQIGVHFYLVYDPDRRIQEETLTAFVLVGGEWEPLPPPVVFKRLGIGLTLWTGKFEHTSGEWLRWTQLDGTLIPTGAERADAADLRAAAAEKRITELEARLATVGGNP